MPQLYPNIDSCLTVTYAYNTGIRSGGHAVIIETLGLTLEEMLERWNMDQATIFYILGCIQIWNNQFFGPSGLNESFTINGHLVNSVESVVPALGYNASSNAVLYNTANNSGSVDIRFAVNQSRLLTITVHRTGEIIYNETWPAYEPDMSLNSNELRLYHSICMLILYTLAQFFVM